MTHVDGLSRIIPKSREPLKATVIASLRSEMDMEYVLYNIVKELSVTQEEIRYKVKLHEFIIQTKQN